jgi:hypothetical protein
MQDIQLGEWRSKFSGNPAVAVRTDDTHVWYTHEASSREVCCLRSVWLESMYRA